MKVSGQPIERFRHEALLYADWPDFVAGTVPFIREGLAAGEPILVVESQEKINLLRTVLGPPAEKVVFANMSEVGSNPARIIPAWQEFVDQQGASAHRLRGIGEPIWKGRSADELVECQRHEALLNVAFGHGRPWWLLCPYDTSQLPVEVVKEALRSHEFVREGDAARPSQAFQAEPVSRAPIDSPLPEPRNGVLGQMLFDRGSLKALREWLSEHAGQAGLSNARAKDLVVAANEVATNTVVHGGAAGSARIWTEPGILVCEIRGGGAIDAPLADRRRPDSARTSPRGLWVANQLCDLMQIRSGAYGTTVRLRMDLHPHRHLQLAGDSSNVN